MLTPVAGTARTRLDQLPEPVIGTGGGCRVAELPSRALSAKPIGSSCLHGMHHARPMRTYFSEILATAAQHVTCHVSQLVPLVDRVCHIAPIQLTERKERPSGRVRVSTRLSRRAHLSLYCHVRRARGHGAEEKVLAISKWSVFQGGQRRAGLATRGVPVEFPPPRCKKNFVLSCLVLNQLTTPQIRPRRLARHLAR